MNFELLIRLAGIGQLCILIASALVPDKLDWKNALAGLPRLHRQMFWTYAGYIVLAILFNGTVCLIAANDLAAGGLLARFVCGYIAVFWGIRLALQGVFDARPFLTAKWLKAGYVLLSFVFAIFTLFFIYAAVRKV